VAEVLVGRRNVNLQMVQEGQAVVYQQYLGNCDRTAYLNAEAAAKAQGAGVWNPGNPLKIMPWDYRRSSR
jgi:micrococcal nuclease